MMKLGLFVAVAVCGFLAGRAIPQTKPSPPTASAVDEREAEPPAAGASDTAHPIRRALAPTLGDRPPTVARKSVAEDWMRLVENDPAAASWLRQAVLFELEARRRASAEIRDCFEQSAIGEIDLRLRIGVQASRAEVTIGDALFVEVAKGTPVSNETADCVAEALSGRTVLTDAIDAAPTYTGPVDYVARFVFAEAPEETAR